MDQASNSATKSRIGTRLTLLSLILTTFLITWLWIKPALSFYSQGRTISQNIYTPWQNIFANKPWSPALPIDYLASLLSYIFYHSNLLASAIITALVAAIFITAQKITSSTNRKTLNLLPTIPAALLIIQYTRYYHHIAEPISILSAAIAFYYYNNLKLPHPAKLTIFFIAAFLIYIIIPIGLLPFALLSIITELTKKDLKKSLTLSLLIIIAPYLANLIIFQTSLMQAYQVTLIYHPDQSITTNIIANLSLISWPIILLLSKLTKTAPKLPSQPISISAQLLPATLLIIAAFTATDYLSRTKRLIDYYSQNNNFTAVLDLTKNIPEKDYDMIISHETNRALYHTNQLSTKLFDYPQHYQSLLLSDQDQLAGGILWITYPKLGTIYYEIADINQAQRYNSEALELLGYYPKGLKQLALINIIKKQYPAAKIYLNALSKDWLYRKWTKQYLQKINSPNLLLEDNEITQKQLLWSCKDQDLSKRYAPHDLFASNNKNKMAFEYMMAFGLLTGQHNPVANSIKFLNTLNYPPNQIPKLYEQAILLYTQITGKKADLASRNISSESLITFRNFSQQASQTVNMTAAQAAQFLAKDFRNTYYYYYHFLRPKK